MSERARRVSLRRQWNKMAAFTFNTRKATQAAAIILRELGGTVDYYPLLKLLYIADRNSLRDTGAPITGARPVAMRQGPLPSEVYACVTGDHGDCEFWNAHIQKQGYAMTVRTDPGTDQLCKYEIAALKQVAQKFGHLHPAEIGKITHRYAEYRNHPVQVGRKFIPIRDVLDAVGRSEQADEIIRDAKDSAAIRRMFDGALQ